MHMCSYVRWLVCAPGGVPRSLRASMCKTDNMQIELEHIATMISQLEALYSSSAAKVTTAVMRPPYWRNRVNAVLGTGNLPPSMSAQASALLLRLEKLDRLSRERERALRAGRRDHRMG